MANEIEFGYPTGKTLTYGAYQPDGTVRTSAGTSLPESPASSGYYHTTDGSIATGDMVIVKEGTDVVGVGIYHPETILSSDGLDSVATTEPAEVASNFREMIIQVWRRLFGKSILTKTELKCYKADGSTVATTQAVAVDGATQTQGEAS